VFFIVALIATLAYALQGTLMASYYRTVDPLSAVAYRGLSLGVSMLPLLLFVPASDFVSFWLHERDVLIASVCAALGNLYIARAYRNLPVGIASGVGMSFAAIFAGAFGYLLVGEVLSPRQIFFGGLILFNLMLLGRTHSTGPLPQSYNVRQGGFNCLLFGLFLGGAYSLVGVASRTAHPFLIGYLWEFTIGIIAALMAISRPLRGGNSLARIPARDLSKIALFSSPTAIGTGLYALSMTMGPIGVATAIISTMMVFNTVLAAVFYGERMSTKQWILLLLVCGAVVGLKLSSA
jgi:drug/metabolite transporter (DMT)-like permease